MAYSTMPLVILLVVATLMVLDCQTVSAVPFQEVAPASPDAAGVLDAANLNITSISASDLSVYPDGSITELRLQGNQLSSLPVGWLTAQSLQNLQIVDLSNNNFSAPGSIPALAFANAKIGTSLLMRQAGLRSASLAAGCFDQSTIASVDLHNDYESRAPQRNLFDPFPTGVVRNGFPLGLTSFWIGDAFSLAPSFFAWYGPISEVVTVHLTIDFSETSDVATHITHSLVDGSITPLTWLTVEIRGSLFNNATSTLLASSTMFNSEVGLNLKSLIVPIHAAFLQSEVYTSFPFLDTITLTAPISLYSGASQWEQGLSNVLPKFGLEHIPSLAYFTIDVTNAPTNNQSPFTTLAGRYFAGISGAISIKLPLAGFTSYPNDLFHGLARVGLLSLDMTLLYGPHVTVPVGFFPFTWHRAIAVEYHQWWLPSEWRTWMNRMQFDSVSHRQFFYMVEGVSRSCPAGSVGHTLTNEVPHCAFCPEGMYCPERYGGALEPLVIPCQAGTWNSLTGQTTCTSCPAGTWSDQVGATLPSTCTACALGRFSVHVGAASPSSCGTCDAGSFSASAGTSTCSQCAPGTYSPTSGATTCSTCAAGRYSNVTGAVSDASCNACAPGTFSAADGASSCQMCPAGTFQSSAGATSCVECPAGTWFAFSGATSAHDCLSCPDDRPNSIAGSRSLEGCTVAALVPPNLTAPCRASPGYMTDFNTNACNIPCPLGSFCQAGVAHVCPAGTYADQLASSACTPCSTGRFSTAIGASSAETCQMCPQGTFSSAVRASSCSACPAGTVGTIPGLVSLDGCSSAPCVAGSVICPAGASEPIQVNATRLHAQFTLRRSDGILTGLEDRPSSTAQALLTSPINHRVESRQSIEEESKALLSDIERLILVTCFGMAALAMLVCFIYVPRSTIRLGDLFSTAGPVVIGESPRKEPSQFGVAVSVAFLLCSVLAIVLISTESNEQTQTQMNARTAVPLSGTASTPMEYVILAHAGASDNVRLCNSHSWLGTVSGIQGHLSTVATARGSSCEIVISCLDRCGVIGRAQLPLVVPWQYQLLEYQFTTEDAQSTRSSLSGVLGVSHTTDSSQADLLSDTTLSFSLTESFATRGHESQLLGSGYYVAFASTSKTAPSPKRVTQDQMIVVQLRLDVNDLVLVTSTISRRSDIQIATSIVSLVVSLFSIFAALYKAGRISLARFGISHGALAALTSDSKVHPAEKYSNNRAQPSEEQIV